MVRKKSLCIGVLLGIMMVMTIIPVTAAGAVEEVFPARPVRLIVPWGAGGGTDVLARGLVETAEEHLGVPVAVDNIPGAIGAIGLGVMLDAEPDGYTLSVIDTYIDQLALQGQYEFSIDDFQPIIGLNRDAAAFTVSADSPFETLEEVIAYAEENPGAVSVGHSGTGQGWHLAGAAVAQAYDVDFTYVTYDGAAPAIADVVGGHITAVSVSGAEVSEFVAAGDARVLAIIGHDRMDLYPDVPTMRELGHDVAFYAMRAIAAPAGVPMDRVELLHDAMYEMYQDEGFQQKMADAGIGLMYSSYDDYEQVYRDSVDDAVELMEYLGIQINQ